MGREISEPEISFFPPILNEKGNIFHALKYSDSTFCGFEEAYFSEVHFGDMKGWKQHSRMTSNLVVPVGKVLFIVLDPQKNFFAEFVLGEDRYGRLTMPPGYWLAFAGLAEGKNLLLNVSNLAHDPNEQINIGLETVPIDVSSILSKYTE